MRFHCKSLLTASLLSLLAVPAWSQVQELCAGDSAVLSLASYRGAIQWQSSTDNGTTWNNIPGATSNNYGVIPTGLMYYRAVITEGSCAPIYSSQSMVQYSTLAADAGTDADYCVGGNAVAIGGGSPGSGGTGPYTYSWSPSAGLSSTTVANPDATPSSATDYILVVTDANGCTAMDTVHVGITTGGPQNDSTVFTFTGAPQSFVVPGCVTQVQIHCWGAQGENALVGGATGGLGGYAFGVLSVTAGETLSVYVGGQSGYNGGGDGGINGNAQSGPPTGTYGGKGGGASDVRVNGITLNDRVIVAGGGGGAGHNGVWTGCQVAGPGGNGGSGGGSTGGTGTAGVGTPCNCGGGGGGGGTGGTQSVGGTTGAYAGSTACLRSSWGPGQNGSLGIGGNGSLQYHNGTGGGGGGGGGYYGGGSGANGSDTTPGGGGGGGSSYTGGVTNGVTTSGINSGDGRVSIHY